jgi:hypothetical protein
MNNASGPTAKAEGENMSASAEHRSDEQPPAEQAGADNAPAEDSNAEDETGRRSAVENLSEYLEIGTVLVNQCAHLSALPEGDRVKPLNAAARLMNAQARVAEALATVGKVERVRRTIVEHVQPPAPKTLDLNSILPESPEAALERELTLKMLRYLALVAGETLDGPLAEAEREEALRVETERYEAERDRPGRDGARHGAPP